MGMLIRENRFRYKFDFTKRRNLILVLAGVILLIAESIILKKYMGIKDNNLSLLLMPLVPLMFLLLKEINLNISGGRIQLIRNVSLMIYLIHPMIKVIIINIGLYYSIDAFTHNSSILFTLVSLFSLVFSLFYGYYKLNKSCGIIGFFRGLK